MQRDMALVRKLLLAIEASERPLDTGFVRIANFTGEQIAEHVRMLCEAGLVEGVATSTERGVRWSELRLTWIGHDFIDAARNEVVWRAVNDAINGSTGTASFSVWRAALLDETFKSLGVPPSEDNLPNRKVA